MWDRPSTGTSTSCNWPDQLHTDGVHLEVTRDANSPGKFAGGEALTERRTQPITGVRQHTAKAHTGCDHAIDLSQGHLRFRSCSSIFDRNARSLQPPPDRSPTSREGKGAMPPS